MAEGADFLAVGGTMAPVGCTAVSSSRLARFIADLTPGPPATDTVHDDTYSLSTLLYVLSSFRVNVETAMVTT